MTSRVINVSVLPGEPTDGSGKVCIHLLVRDERGPFTEPHILHPVIDDCGNPVKNELVARPTRVRLACDPKRQVAPIRRGNTVTVVHRTESVEAVTCPKCKQSKEYIKATSKPE